MFYEGNDIEELIELMQYESEPVVVINSFLSDDDVADMTRFHGWNFEPQWYRTEVISWGPGAVSSRTTQHQRLTPPADWQPQERPAPVDPEPVDPETPPEGQDDSA